MKQTENTKHQRWRLTEKVTHELHYSRRQGGYKSWDEFFTVLLYKWNQRGPPAPVEDPKGLQELKILSKEILGHHQAIRELIEDRKEQLQGLADGQQRMMEVLAHMEEILQQAIKAGHPSSTGSEPIPEDPGIEVMRKIRNRPHPKP